MSSGMGSTNCKACYGMEKCFCPSVTMTDQPKRWEARELLEAAEGHAKVKTEIKSLLRKTFDTDRQKMLAYEQMLCRIVEYPYPSADQPKRPEGQAAEYQPWLELGISEVEYWKQRYIEARKESPSVSSATREKKLEEYLSEAIHYLRLIGVEEHASSDTRQYARYCADLLVARLEKPSPKEETPPKSCSATRDRIFVSHVTKFIADQIKREWASDADLEDFCHNWTVTNELISRALRDARTVEKSAYDALQAENQRLREALERIAENGVKTANSQGYAHLSEWADKVKTLARQALAPKGE